jgi:hypothetical protein
VDFVACTLAVKKKIRAGFDMSDRTIPLLDLALPTFENKLHQNAQEHLNSLGECLQIMNIPPPLQIAMAWQSLKGIPVMTCADAKWDQMETFIFSPHRGHFKPQPREVQKNPISYL